MSVAADETVIRFGPVSDTKQLFGLERPEIFVI